ncbi:uncharacterized protein M6B38_138130 [Iris pallida]|uniref:Uncharacterized protein n=1 Tax=Iris pallida TaxID=29817 RepID=A0AAX6FEG6_IRIPA|nr:uncharacterized protein M6B38_138130 [Iris pallida]
MISKSSSFSTSPSSPMAIDAIPVIDVRLLSHSDLLSLAASSPAAFDLRHLSDVVPKIDRSVFNESAGSRKQTYSRLPLSPNSPNSPSAPRRRGRPRLHPLPAPPPPPPPPPSDPSPDPSHEENLRIVYHLRRLFELRTGERYGKPEPLIAQEKPVVAPVVAEVPAADDRDLELRNAKGEVVDLAGLAEREDPFGEEMRRRTQGLTTAEQILGYMTGLDGEWGSRRRKRKTVDAAVFGDGLPRGWKLHLGLKRKEGTVFLNCRNYVSPTGKQFMSCKEVSSYLLSLTGHHDARHPISDQHEVSTLINPSPVPPPPSSAATGNDTPRDESVSKENLHPLLESREANTQSQSKIVDEVKERALVLVEVGGQEVRNGKGDVINLAQLAEKGDLFGEEIRRRTKELKTEEQVLGYMKGLEGQWGSQRKKRKIVDAGIFGDELPRGWKVLLGLKRKEGVVYLQCRRYVSPSGKQFMSCKEISSYILSLSGDQDAQPISCQYVEGVSRPAKLTSGCQVAGLSHQDGTSNELPNLSFVTPISYKSTDCEKQGLVDRVENPGMAELENMLECHKCKITFGDKDAQVHHMMTSHGRSAKRRRVGNSLGDIIIKDGKFECQFCRKTFSERHRYNGHIGSHVRSQSLHGQTPLYAVAEGTINSSSSLAAVPYDPSMMNVAAQNQEETCTTKSVDVHVVLSYSGSGMENNKTEHDPMLDASEITECVPTGKVVDNSIVACNVIGDKLKEFTEASDVTGVKSPSCRDIIFPSATNVKDAAEDLSPIITYEASPRKSTPFQNDYEMTSDKTAVIEESNVQCSVPNVCLDAITPSVADIDITTCETVMETVLPCSTGKIIDNSISDHIMNEHKSVDMVNISNIESIGTVSDKKYFVDDQSNDHDMGDYNSRVNTSSDPNLCLDSVASSVANVVNATCEIVTETVLLSSSSKIIDNSISDHIMNDHKIEDIVNTSSDKNMGTVNEKSYFVDGQNKDHDMADYKSGVNTCAMSIEGSECCNTISHSLVSVANATLGSSGLINSSSCTDISASPDCNLDHKVEIENHMIDLLGNGSSYGVENYTDGIFTSSVEDHIEFDSNTNRKCANGSCRTLTSDDTDTVSAMHNDLNTGYFIPNFSREQTCGIETTADCMFPGDLNKSIFEEFDNVGNDFRNCFKSSSIGCEDAGAGDTINDDDGRLALQLNLANKSSSWVQSSEGLPFLDMISNQGGNEFGSLGPKCAQANISGFEELRLGSMEPADFVLMSNQGSGSVTRSPIELVPSSQLEWGLSLSNMVSTVAPTSVCVWCNSEFINEDGEAEPQSGSLGYMCPGCKSRISGLDLVGSFP